MHIGISIYERYRKMSFRNRCLIPAANGVVSLSVPLVGGRENALVMKDVKIDHTVNWQQRHWRTITSAYGRSPWFEFYGEELGRIYSRSFTYLADWDHELLRWIFTSLSMETRIDILEKEPQEGPENLIYDLRNKIFPKNFQEAEFTKDLPFYAQVFQDKIGFQPNMSIIDLIFCEGRNARTYLG